MQRKLHDALLETALALATIDPGRPKQANLRRSISTSYYSLFHAINFEWSRQFKPVVRNASRRMLQHGATKNSAVNISNQGILWCIDPSYTCDVTTKSIAKNFVDLQAKRHDADYNLSVVNLMR